jgi:hypothetical protein
MQLDQKPVCSVNPTYTYRLYGCNADAIKYLRGFTYEIGNKR